MTRFVIPPYNYTLYLAIDETSKGIINTINRRLKKSSLKLSDSEVAFIKEHINSSNLGICIALENPSHGILWLSKDLDPSNRKDFITLSHETIHVCIRIFEFIGSEVDGHTEEPFCYLHDYIMEICLKELEGKKNENSSTSKKSVRVIQELAEVSKSNS